MNEENQTNGPQRVESVDATDSAAVEESALRQFDAFIGRWLGASAGAETMADLMPDRDWRVDLHRVGEVFGKARIDIGRDGVWNEDWELREGQVFRTVHEENGDVVYRLDGTRWLKQLP